MSVSTTPMNIIPTCTMTTGTAMVASWRNSPLGFGTRKSLASGHGSRVTGHFSVDFPLSRALVPTMSRHRTPPRSDAANRFTSMDRTMGKTLAATVIFMAAFHAGARTSEPMRSNFFISRIESRDMWRSPSHAAAVLPADFKKGAGDLPERAHAHGIHQHFKHVPIVDHRLLQALQHWF